MPTFNYTTGDPSNLIGGGLASMDDMSGPFADVQTFLNGSLDVTNLATSVKPATVLSQYRTLSEATFQIGGGDLAGVYIATMSGSHRSSSAQDLGNSAPMVTQLAATDLEVAGLTTRLRVSGALATNATAPAVSFTYGLYPVTAAGTDGNDVTLLAGTVVSASTVTRATPSASSSYQDDSSDFAVPADGGYLLGVALSGTTAANCYVAITLRLAVHQV